MPPAEIFKIQRPLSSNIPDAPALIYNADRSKEFQMAMDSELEMMLAGRAKIYVWAYVEEGGEFTPTADAPDQAW